MPAVYERNRVSVETLIRHFGDRCPVFIAKNILPLSEKPFRQRGNKLLTFGKIIYFHSSIIRRFIKA